MECRRCPSHPMHCKGGGWRPRSPWPPHPPGLHQAPLIIKHRPLIQVQCLQAGAVRQVRDGIHGAQLGVQVLQFLQATDVGQRILLGVTAGWQPAVTP
ncbi:hypothetical protein HaLaN_01472 [Haematococcus lacustris]|uniref:Uncharacterized protein n=1 Tax=Haematococcus lacustris TaxID=44745 RepID=A0A699Y9C7_HAELA|nr:hypothetical protein HaLaN_01472 [Haematococcus lacustris]